MTGIRGRYFLPMTTGVVEVQFYSFSLSWVICLVWLQLLHLWRKLQRFLVTDCIWHICVSCNWENGAAWVCVWWCYCTFHSVVEVKFLHVCWTITHSLVTHHFIHKCCVFHMYITIAGFNGQWLPSVLRCTVNVTAQGRKTDTFQISKESSTVCS